MVRPPLVYVATDVPPGTTLRAWRHSRRPARRLPRARWLGRRLLLLMERACIICGRRSRGARCPRHQLRSRPRGNAFEPTRQRILERDAWRCQVQLPGVCLGTATVVDHVVRLADGGSDADSNLRAACAPCNLARGRGGPPVPGRNPAAR